jgi:hypothetical protein
MADSELPTFEEAKKCPECGSAGVEVRQMPAPKAKGVTKGATIHVIKCPNLLGQHGVEQPDVPSLAPVYLVQTNPDGTVPPKQDHSKHEKIYVGFEGHDEMAARVIEGLKAEKEASQRPDGYRVRNPHDVGGI